MHSTLTLKTILPSAAAALLFIFTAGAQTHQTAAPSHSAVASRDSYADIVDRVSPAVVTIRSARRMRAPQQFPFMDDPFFRQFFGNGNPNRNRPNNNDRSQVEHALGSGVIVSPGGHILTNHHVVDGAEDISVELSDRRTFKAKLIGSDAPSDLALLKIDATGLPVLPLATPIKSASATSASRSVTRLASARPSPPESSVPRDARPTSATETSKTSSRPTRPSTRATPAEPLSARTAN